MEIYFSWSYCSWLELSNIPDGFVMALESLWVEFPAACCDKMQQALQQATDYQVRQDEAG